MAVNSFISTVKFVSAFADLKAVDGCNGAPAAGYLGDRSNTSAHGSCSLNSRISTFTRVSSDGAVSSMLLLCMSNHQNDVGYLY
jgi:hypothetical protein